MGIELVGIAVLRGLVQRVRRSPLEYNITCMTT